MTPALLRKAGELLYGPRWQTEIALAIGVSNRTIRRWLSGEWPVPDGAWFDLLEHAKEREAKLGEFLSDELARHEKRHKRENK